MKPVAIDRDSVCMGDDVDDHRSHLELEDGLSLSQAIARIRDQYSLASIAGGKATWTILADGQPIGLEAQQWPDRAFTTDPDQPFLATAVHFRYHCQRDPEVALEELRTGKPVPRR
jgi:hypothetical protein